LTFDHNFGKCRPSFKEFYRQISKQTVIVTIAGLPSHLNCIATLICEI